MPEKDQWDHFIWHMRRGGGGGGGGVQDLCPVTSLLPVYDSSYFLIFLRKAVKGKGKGVRPCGLPSR